MATHRTLFRAPPKSAFQALCDTTLIEEISRWRVVGDEEVGDGATWTERRLLRRRTWTVSEFDRRGLSFVMDGQSVQVRFTAKKGGPGSCNVEMKVTGEATAVARFERTDGDRLERLVEWFDGPPAKG